MELEMFKMSCVKCGYGEFSSESPPMQDNDGVYILFTCGHAQCNASFKQYLEINYEDFAILD